MAKRIWAEARYLVARCFPRAEARVYSGAAMRFHSGIVITQINSAFGAEAESVVRR